MQRKIRVARLDGMQPLLGQMQTCGLLGAGWSGAIKILSIMTVMQKKLLA